MREENGVSVRITSSKLPAADIAARVGLTGDNSWAAGATYGVFGATEKQHGLSLQSRLGPSAPLEEHFREMLKRLAPAAQKLGLLAAEVEVVFACTVHSRRAPALHFDRDSLRWLGAMQARLEIDTVVISEAPKPAAGKPTGG